MDTADEGREGPAGKWHRIPNRQGQFLKVCLFCGWVAGGCGKGDDDDGDSHTLLFSVAKALSKPADYGKITGPKTIVRIEGLGAEVQ